MDVRASFEHSQGPTETARPGSRDDPWLPQRVEEFAAVRAQLERILGYQAFRNSRRYPRFLAFVVEETIAGRQGNLKERTVGIEVFGRAPDYDTNADHVVRTAAGEVRKRLAQYYQEPGREAEIRIGLHPGSYVPEFFLPSSEWSVLPNGDLTDNGHPAEVCRSRRWWLIPAVGAVLTTAALAFYLAPGILATSQSALDHFWAPVLASPERVLICIGGTIHASDSETSATDAVQQFTYRDFMRSGELHVALNEAATLARLAGLLRREGKLIRVAGRAATTLRDLRDGPAVLIGGGNNEWTRRATGELRFRFERDPDRGITIRDEQDPSPTRWALDSQIPFDQLTVDYALVSRLLGPNTEQMVVVAAGLGTLGTFAAGEFLSEVVHMEKLVGVAGPGWEHQNLQVVVSTQIVNGSPGPPKVEAVHTW